MKCSIKLYVLVTKVITAILCICFAFITVGAAVLLFDKTIYDLDYQSFIPLNCVILISAIGCTLFLFWFANNLRGRGRLAQLLFALALIVAITALTYLSVRFIKPRLASDSYDCFEAAAYLLKQGRIDEGCNSYRYISIFANNHTLVLLDKTLLALLGDIDYPSLLQILYIINTCCIVLATIISYYIVYTCRDITTANRMLVLCALNPLYYGLAGWVYSLTLSLPIMMSIVLVSIYIYRSTSLKQVVVLSVIEAILTAIGYEIRPTAVFPVIACMLVLACCVLGGNPKIDAVTIRKWTAVLLAFALVTICSLWVIGQEKSRYFSQMDDEAYPISYWISMGSHDEGSIVTNSEDRELVSSLSPDKRSSVMFEHALQNYKENGLIGTIKLWGRKMLATWSDGYSSINRRIRKNESQGSFLYEFMGGCNKSIFVAYCQVFRLCTCVGVLLACIGLLRKKTNQNLLYSVLLTTILGGIVFYWLWESKDVYSAAFVFILLILAEEGWSLTLGQFEKRFKIIVSQPNNKRIVYAASVCFTIISAGCFYCFFGTECARSYSRISSTEDVRENTPLLFESEIEQEMYIENIFNQIVLSMKERTRKGAGSSYRASLTDSSGNVLARWRIRNTDIEDDRVILASKAIRPKHGGDWYHLRVTRVGKKRPRYCMVTGQSVLLDSYNGSLYIDGIQYPANDLKLDVEYHVNRPYLSKKNSMLICVLWSLASLYCIHKYICYTSERAMT